LDECLSESEVADNMTSTCCYGDNVYRLPTHTSYDRTQL